MHIYTVHLNPKAAEPLENAIFVKEGFSWLATIFTFFWMIYHRIWWAAIAIMVYNMAVAYLQETQILSAEIATIINVAVVVIIGLSAGDWYRDTLRRRGYVLTEIVSGMNEEQAEQRFLDLYLASKPVTPPPTIRGSAYA
jgi:hypothetical protein